MELIPLLILGVVGYVVLKCVQKSSQLGKNEAANPDPPVQTIKHWEDPSNAQVDVSYHMHDYRVRGQPTFNEPGLYGTLRSTYLTPTNNLQVDDNRLPGFH